MEKNKTSKTIGIYHLIFGALGILYLVYMVFALNIVSSKELILYGVFIFLCILLAISGYAILLKHKWGIYLAILLQLLQIFNFSLMGFEYEFCSGIDLSIYLTELKIDFNFLYVEFSLMINSIEEEYVSVNIIPIIITGFLVNLLRKQ
jgi:hypothetical protein